jgi:hypothetical protein
MKSRKEQFDLLRQAIPPTTNPDQAYEDMVALWAMYITILGSHSPAILSKMGKLKDDTELFLVNTVMAEGIVKPN